MLAKKTIDEVRELDLVQAISKYVDLKKAGSQYEGKSPFTDEKTGSFYVSPSKNCWKCFSTGKGGNNPIAFLMEAKHLSFVDAVKTLADENNIVIEYDESERSVAHTQKQEKIQTISSINSIACDFWKERIAETPKEFIRSADTMNQLFDLGFAPNEWHLLNQHLIKKGFTPEQMLEAGLIAKGEKGYYDFFRNRVIFPIKDWSGNILGFSGRLTEELTDKTKKYKILNSKETDAFSKNKVLLGIFEAKEEIIKLQKAILVEGNYDVTSMHELGFRNTVASLGTSFTEDHIKLLKRTKLKTLSLFVDNDKNKAGIKKIEPNTILALSNGLHVNVFIPGVEGQDPDDWCKSLKKSCKADVLLKSAQEAFAGGEMDAVEYLASVYFENAEDLTIVQTSEAEQKLSTLLTNISDANLRNKYVKKFAKLYKVDKTTVEKSISIAFAEKETDDETGKKKFKPKVPLSDDEFEDFMKYGFYPNKQKGKIGYYFGDEQICNWLMRPLFQVADVKESKRFIELTTERGKVVAEVPNSKINSPQAFETQISNLGGYFFHGTTKQYQRLKAKFLLQFPLCTEIKTLGWYYDGFYAFANGIIENGNFKAVDSYGTIIRDDKWYFLPAYSSIYINADADNDIHASDRSFVYKAGGFGFEKWAKKFYQVYNDADNGMFAIAFLCATLFSDISFKMNNYFPLLYMYGMPRTGKSTCARSLTRVFKSEYVAYNLNSGTITGYQRVLARVRNCLEHFDEYRNDIPEDKFQFLKRAYDRSSAPKGQMTNDNKTVEMKINSAIVGTGQHTLTRDGNALFSRCITLEFTKTQDKFTNEEIKEYNDLTEMENKGLSDVIVEIIRYRALMEEKYNDMQFTIGNQLRDEFAEAKKTIDGRVTGNFTVVLSTVKILSEVLKFPFKYEALYAQSKEYIIKQSELISISDELAEFFDMMAFLSLSHMIRHNEDYVIKDGLFDIKVGRGDKTEIKKLNGQKILYVRMAKIFPLYMEHIRKQGAQGLPQLTLISYMRTHKAFIGDIKTVRFGEDSTSAFAFDYDVLKITLKTDQATSYNQIQENKLSNVPQATPSFGVQMEIDPDLPF